MNRNTYSASRQRSEPGGGATSTQDEITARGGVLVVDYDREKELLEKFLREHTIVVNDTSANDDDDDDDRVLWEPVEEEEYGSGVRRKRIPAYADHLQRIVNREYYSEESRIFIVEVPLQELANHGQADLAQRANDNALRYEEVFSQVVDAVLETMTTTTTTTTTTQRDDLEPDSVELLYRHRLAAQQQQRHARQQAQAAAVHNHYAGNQGVGGDDDNDNNATAPDRNASSGATEAFPALLLRRYELRILPLGRPGSLPPFHAQYHKAPPPPPLAVSLRQVRSQHMGRLVTLQGMIVRASDVKPQALVVTYSCDSCGAEIYQPTPYQREFMPPKACVSADCQQQGNNKAGSLQMQTRGSKFIKFQELRLQELPSQVPMGHVPRSLVVHCRGELTRLAAPGDVVTVDGIYLPQRLAESGFRALKAGLVSITYLQAQNIIVHKKSYDDTTEHENLSAAERAALQASVQRVAESDDPVGILSSSIAPEIFGHEDIKRALLLQLVGGVTRSLPDGMRIRGDLNLCLMGDPGVAKSQLLKHVASIAPRGVYTTGKGSSGVGLTAAVTKDVATGEMALEGGALVLADRGICCIDEFDKMDEADRTAIHEVMEQQQVSIAKAGIVATLNARSAVLAAANPLYSRYNRNKTLSENIALPNSLLSRFDLLFLVLDIANVDRDMALARHVTLVHQNEGLLETTTTTTTTVDGKKADPNDDDSDDDSDDENQNPNGNNRTAVHDTEQNAFGPVSPAVLREYICHARKHQPVVPPEVAPYIVEAYVSLRLQEKRGGSTRNNKMGSSSSDQTAMTARQLLSILRLSQALARLRFSDFVARQDVDEAIRLTHMSKASLENSNNNNDNLSGLREDVMSRIFQVLRDYLAATSTTTTTRTTTNEDHHHHHHHPRAIDLSTAEAMVLRKGFTAQQFQTCLEEYEALRVIQINQTRTHIYFL